MCAHCGGVFGLDGGPEGLGVQPVQVVVQVGLQVLGIVAELNTHKHHEHASLEEAVHS